MINCKICKKRKASEHLKVCKECIERNFEKALVYIKAAHEKTSKPDLPPFPPRDPKGKVCKECSNRCQIPENEKGFCGLIVNKNGKLVRLAGVADKGILSAYVESHPTNCTSGWICGSTGIGYPKYSILPYREIGYNNLAVFYMSCSMRCQYCQNWSYLDGVRSLRPSMSASELITYITEKTSCICLFGGSMTPQMPHAIAFAKLARVKAKNEGRILRICSETNGLEDWNYLKKFAKMSLESGGGIKFDLKFPRNSNLSIALSGVSNDASYQNFEKLVDLHQKRPEVPFLRASTLLIPHYIDLKEVRKIIEFITSLDPSIPYSLLAFYPCYKMNDIGLTTKKFAEKCLKIAKKQKLERVRIGNIHLLK